MNVQRLILDLDKSSVPRGRVTIAQCDHDGTTVEAEIYDNGIALDTSGLSAYLVMRLPDGRHYYRVPATLDGHVATALMDEAYAATATGTTEIAYFELVGSGGVVYSTSRFGVRVLPSATADATVPETWDGEVEQLIQQLDEMAESSRVIIDDLTTLEETVGAAERGRVSAESGRVSAETARANAETARRNAETARANAESGRITAEQGRVAAESSRVSEFSTLKAESQAATSAATTAASAANTAAGNATTAANVANAAAANADATADGVESRVQEMAQDAAETATADAEQRIQAAIDAMGDISELAVPLMSKDVRGGAKLEEHGGLVLRDEKLGIGSLVQQSDGYARGGLAEVTAKGHAEQVQTTGKNLLPNTATSRTINGVTFTVNADGSVTVNGTATAKTTLALASATATPELASRLQDKTLMLSGCPSNGGVNSYRLAAYHVDGTTLTLSDSGSGVSFRFSYDENAGFNFAIIISEGFTCNNLTFYPQLEAGSTATSYEPYTGGAPSPSPDYPQDIQVVRGRNLFNKAAITSSAALDDNGNILQDSSWIDYCVSDYIKVYAGEPVYIPRTSSARRCLYDSSKTFVEYLNNSQAQVYTPKQDGFLRITIWRTVVSIDTFQISIGSTPQPYVPYGHVGLEVAHPWTVYMETGAIDSTGSEDASASSHHVLAAKLPQGSYCLVYDKTGFNAQTRVHAYKDGSWVRQLTSYSTLTAEHVQLNLAVGVDVDEVRISIPKEFTNVKLISATPIPLPSRGWVGSLPDGTADSLALDGAGKVEWELVDEEVVLDGSSDEDWMYESVNTGFRLRNMTTEFSALGTSTLNLFTSHFRPHAWAIGTDKTVQFSSHRPLFTYFGIEQSTAAWTAWLSTHNVTVLYPIATPVIEDCGYVNMPSIEGDCTISIPELDALGVKYFVDDSAGTLARQWYERAKSEYADRLEALEAAVADLVTGA